MSVTFSKHRDPDVTFVAADNLPFQIPGTVEARILLPFPIKNKKLVNCVAFTSTNAFREVCLKETGANIVCWSLGFYLLLNLLLWSS